MGIRRRRTITGSTDNRTANHRRESDRFFELSLDLLAVASIRDGHWKKVNPAFFHTLGWTEDELFAMPFFDIVHPEDLEKTREAAAGLAMGQELIQFEQRVRCKDGSYKWISWSTAPYQEEGLMYCIGRDITHHRKIEKELAGRNEMLQKIVDYIPVMLVIWDPKLQSFQLNNHATSVLGWTNTDAQEGDFMSKVYPDEKYRLKVSEYMRSLSPEWRELNLMTKNGQYIISEWRNIQLSDDTMIGIGIDLRERKQAEEELRRSEALYRSIAANLPGGAVFILDRDLRYVLADGKALEDAGFTAKDLEGRTLWEALGPDKAGEYEPFLRSAFDGKQFEYEHSSHGRYYISVGVPLRDANGEIAHILTMSYDITERKEAEKVLERDNEALEKLIEKKSKELLDAQEKLKEAQRLSDIGVLAATVAHELRNPLSAITLAAYNLQRKINDQTLIRKIENINTKISESEMIIENLLFYSRLRPPQFDEIRPYEVIKESLEEFQEGSFHSIEVIGNGIDKLRDFTLKADPHQIKEVIVNLLNNAADAIGKGAGVIELTAHVNENFFKLSIHDNGEGIEGEHLEKIFDPFFTTKARGTGLGLTVCRQIVELHKGTLTIESDKNTGTEVTVSLPIRTGER